MKKTCIIGLLLLITYCIHGQSVSDSITVKKAFGVVFQQNGQNLTPRMLLNITSSNSESYKEMKIAKSNYDAGSVFGFAGGFLVGWPLGTSIAGGDPNWTLAAVGAGLIVISIPFTSAYSRHAKEAVKLYNNGLKQSALSVPEVRLGFTYYGIGIKVNF